MEPERPFLPGAGADLIWPESVPGTQTFGAGSSTRNFIVTKFKKRELKEKCIRVEWYQ